MPLHRHAVLQLLCSPAVRITCGNLKGGVGKTTTALYLAHGFARLGRTLLVDADPQGSLLELSSRVALFPCTTIHWPTGDLGRRVAGVAGDFAHIVIDTGPENEKLLRQALSVTEAIVIPCAPSLFDVDRLGPTLDVVDAAADFYSVDPRILITKVRPGRRASDARQGLTDQGFPVMDAQVRLLDVYQEVFNDVPTDLHDYQGVLDELTGARRRDGVTA